MVVFNVGIAGIPGARDLEVEADPEATIADVIKQIVEQAGIPEGEYSLLYNGRALDPEEKVREVGIRDGDEVKLVQGEIIFGTSC